MHLLLPRVLLGDHRKKSIMNVDIPARNFLLKNSATSLAVVMMNPHGKPDSISYWKNDTAESETEQPARYDRNYETGVLMDIWV